MTGISSSASVARSTPQVGSVLVAVKTVLRSAGLKGQARLSCRRAFANRITAITHATTPYWSRGYAYDGLDRIASFVSDPRDQIFSNDAVGNLLVKTDRVGTTYNISPTSNRMTGIGSMGIGYAVDAADNRTSEEASVRAINSCATVSNEAVAR